MSYVSPYTMTTKDMKALRKICNCSIQGGKVALIWAKGDIIRAKVYLDVRDLAINVPNRKKWVTEEVNRRISDMKRK